MGSFEPLGLDHVVLRVKDQEASQRFYIDVLGARLDHVNERISLVHLRFGEAMIDLIPGERGEGGGGVDHVCLSVRCPDLATLREELVARDVKLEGEIV